MDASSETYKRWFSNHVNVDLDMLGPVIDLFPRSKPHSQSVTLAIMDDWWKAGSFQQGLRNEIGEPLLYNAIMSGSWRMTNNL
jgi:hypothetical protein